jgi:uncharacterized integral membrane protein
VSEGPKSGAPSKRAARTRNAAEIALVAVVIYAVVFLLVNTGKVHVHFVFWSATIALSWVIFLCLMLGLAAGLLLPRLRARRRRARG